MPETERRLNVPDGASLFYRLWRDGGRRPLLLLLHGAASNHTRWSELLEATRLKESWDVLRPDLRGNGASAYRGRLSLEIWAADLARILEAEGYARAVVVGHSLGAQIGLHFAALHPRLAAGLVLIDPLLPEAPSEETRRRMRWRPALRAAVSVLRLLNRLGLRRRSIPDRDLRQLDEEVRQALLSGGDTEAFVRKYSSIRLCLEFMPTANYLQQLLEQARPTPDPATIGAPVLILQSVGADFNDSEGAAERIGRFPRVEVETIDATHWPLTEKPAEVRRAIERWCERPEIRRAASG